MITHVFHFGIDHTLASNHHLMTVSSICSTLFVRSIGYIPWYSLNDVQISGSHVHARATIGDLQDASILAHVHVLVKMTIPRAQICHASETADCMRCLYLMPARSRPSSQAKLSHLLRCCSAVSIVSFIYCNAWSGYSQTAVSPESITASTHIWIAW